MIKTELIKEEHKIVIKEHVSVLSHQCDLCGQDLIEDRESSYEHDSVTIKRVVGGNYPDGDCRDVIEFDICGGCFEYEITEFFESKGVKPRERSHDELWVKGL